MTITADSPSTEAPKQGGIGRVARVIGPVVDVEFAPDEMPEIYNALHVERTLGGETTTLTLEVAQHIGDNLVRAIAMQPTDGLVRGAPVHGHRRADLGARRRRHQGPRLQRPRQADGRRRVDLDIQVRWPIHRPSPAFDQLESKTEMFETGIKVIDLLTPYVHGGKIGLFGGAGVGKTVLIQEMIYRVAKELSAACRCSPVSASAPARATTCSVR